MLREGGVSKAQRCLRTFMQRKPSGGAKQPTIPVTQAAAPSLALRLLQMYVALTMHAAAIALPSCKQDALIHSDDLDRH